MIKEALIEKIQYYRWKKEAKDKSFILSDKEIDINLGNVLYIVPHADDEFISGFQFLKKIKESLIIYYCGMTGSNNDPDNKNVRDKEIEALCKQSGFVLFSPTNWIEELEKAIINNNINTVFLPSFVDWHFEHRKVNEIVAKLDPKAISQLSFYWYSVSVPICMESALLFPMDKKEQSVKYSLFKQFYRSQSNLPVKRFMIQEQTNARLINAFAAEVFKPVSIQQIIKSFGIPLDTIDNLKTNINCISTIRDKSAQLYESVFRY